MKSKSSRVSKPFQQYYNNYKITDSITGGMILEANEEKNPLDRSSLEASGGIFSASKHRS